MQMWCGGERRSAPDAAIEAKGNDATAKERSVLTCLEMVVEAMSGRHLERVDSPTADRHFHVRAAASGRACLYR